MKELVEKWSFWADKFAARTHRERLNMAFAIIFGSGFLLFNFVIDPGLQKARSARKTEEIKKAELAQLESQLVVLNAQNADPDAISRERIAQAKSQMAAIGSRLTRFEAGMVAPSQMQEFLQGLLAKNNRIQLLEMKTLPVTQIGAPDKSEKADPNQPQGKDGAKEKIASEKRVTGSGDSIEIYQHGIEMKIAGSYNDLLSYLTELEHLPQNVIWNSVQLTVEKYPRNILVLKITTMSLDRNWLTL